LIPHKQFTFAKIWLLKAHFEVRQFSLPAARKTLGQAIGMCPKDKLFKGYIKLETRLHEFTRCRTLYRKHIEFNPANAQTWIRFAELEMALEDYDRVRAIFEMAVNQEMLDMPELLWKAYIDFEEESGEYERTRMLFERLLEKTDHVKVWISYAHFEVNADEGGDEDDEAISEATKRRARAVFERAHKSLKAKELKEEVCPPAGFPTATMLIICRESYCSAPGNRSKTRTARPRISRGSTHRCRGRSRSGES
jgi:crooked neck